MVRFTEVYGEEYTSGAINTTASELFGNDQASNRQKYGSANSLILTNLAAENFLIKLDGRRTMGILYANGGTFVIKPEDGIFYDYVELENISGTNSSADEVKIRIARANAIGA